LTEYCAIIVIGVIAPRLGYCGALFCSWSTVFVAR